MGVLKLLASDQTTVLWDFDDPTGAANPSTVLTNLAAGVDMGTIEPALRTFRVGSGARLLGQDNPPVEMEIGFTASAATDNALWAGLGQLGRFLAAASPSNPVYLKWDELTETRYIDVIGALNLPQLLRGQALAGIVALRKNSLGPIPLRLLRQPWMRGPEVSQAGVTVPNDPATSTKVRVYPLTVTGDLPTPGKVRVQMDTGSTVQRVLIAHRARGTRAATFFSDYLATTGFFQCEATNRSWTIALGTNTSSVADALASGGNVARVTHATDPTVYNRRVRATRTAGLDSLRGSWDVWLRVKAAAARDYRLKLLWGPSTADPPEQSNTEVQHTTAANGTPPAFGYVELNLGRVHLPETVALGALALEVWTRQSDGPAANLDLDLIWLVPAENQSTVVVPGAGDATTVDGGDLITPVANPAGGTAGTVVGEFLNLDTTTDNAGTTPAAGFALAAGRWRVTYLLTAGGGSGSALLRVRNITDSTDTATRTVTLGSFETPCTLDFDAVAGKSYQFQIDDPTFAVAQLTVTSVSWQFLPSLGLNESVRTDPARHAVDRLDSSGNLAGYLGTEGGVPVILEPGDNHLMVRADEVPLALYDEGENKLARTPTVSVIYSPRYAL